MCWYFGQEVRSSFKWFCLSVLSLVISIAVLQIPDLPESITGVVGFVGAMSFFSIWMASIVLAFALLLDR